MSGGFSSEEKRKLVRRLAGSDPVECPRCGGRLDKRPVPPRQEVAYVRDRVWLLCGDCGASGVVDRRAVDRESENGDG